MKPFHATNLAERAAGLAGTAVGAAGPLARAVVHVPVDVARRAVHLAGAATGRGGTAESDSVPGAPGAQSRESGPTEPTVVAVEPHAPDEPPVDVVGEALAAEAAAERGDAPDGAGLAHEPRGASRDEEHGDAALQRAEVDEVAAETAAALGGDVEPEEHLTQPLVDSADANAVAAEMATMRKAADPDKG